MITTTVISTTTSLSTRKVAQHDEQQELLMTSLDIAELCGKPHNDILKAIRKMEPAWEKVQAGKFSLLQKCYDLPNGGKKMMPYYSLTKTETLYIATKFKDEMRAKLVLRWEQLERERLGDGDQLALPSPKKILSLADDIIGTGLRVLNEAAEDTLTATQVAKTFNMTTLDFNAVLRDMGIQYRRNGRWNLSDDLQGRGYTAERTHVSYSLKGEKKIRHYMTWTLEGLRFLNSKLGYPNF
jgi:phage regulator Rha-like protein